METGAIRVDTAGDWKLAACFAVLKHESSNQDTSERIRRSLRSRFAQGGIIQFVIFGYVKPPGAKSDAELHSHRVLRQDQPAMLRQRDAMKTRSTIGPAAWPLPGRRWSAFGSRLLT